MSEDGIHFRAPPGSPAPAPLKTELQDLKYLGALRPTDPSEPRFEPYFLFTGRPCKGCLHDSGIYAIRASGGRPFAFVHPGKITDPKNGGLLLESRGFFGRCLAGSEQSVYVVFQKERIDRKKRMQPSVLIAEPGPDHMHERLLEKRLPRLKDTLRRVRAKACQEIEGRNRKGLSKPLDVDLHRTVTDTDDEDEKPATTTPQN